jgi:competence protein ComEA
VSAIARGFVAAATLLVAAPAPAAGKALPPGERIDLNRAPVTELMRVPGLGLKRAQAIVSHRQRHPFRRPEDVIAVKGLGKAWFHKVKGNLVVGSAAAPATPTAAATAPVATAARK